MSENKPIKIRRKVEIPKIRLWLIWLLLFVFPSIIASIGFDIFSKEYAYFARTDLISEAYENIRKYNESIVPENFLESQLKEIQDLDTSKTINELKSNIDRILCGETLFCLFFDEKIDKILVTNIDNQKDRLKNIPIYFFKKHIKNLIFDNNEKNNQDLSSDSEQFGIFLQQLFKTASNITIKPNKVSKNFSVKYDGEIYFIFCNFTKPSKECFGFFAVMKGISFKFHKMLERLNTDNPEIKIVFKEVVPQKSYETPEFFYSGIKHEKDGLHIVAPSSNKFVRHVLHGGGKELDERYGNLFPFIDYHIPQWKYLEKINHFAKNIRIISLAIVLLSSIYFLNISLFGFNEKISFKTKIIFFTVISAAFPFGIFTFSIYTLNEYENFISKLRIQQHVETVLQMYTNNLERYLDKLESKILDSATKLSDIYSKQGMNPTEFIDYYNSIGEKIPVSWYSLLFDSVPIKLKDKCNNNKITKKYLDRISKLLINDDKDAFYEEYTEKALKYAKEDTISSRIVEYTEEQNSMKFSNTDLNDFLTNEGKLRKITRLYSTSFCTFHFIHNYSKDNEVVALLFTIFETKPILADFISKSSFKKNNFKEKKEKYLIDYAFLPIEDSGTASIWKSDGIISDEIKKFCLQNPTSETIDNFSKDKIIIKKRNQLIPHLAVATINLGKTEYSLFIAKTIIALITYFALILYFANSLLDFLIVEPVIKLATNARAIAAGEGEWNIKIDSGDEFEELNNNFKKLVIGLKERNILKSYVSEDAFSDIEESDSLKLLPGGEYLEATIVFSAIKDYDKLSSSMTPEESIKLLSKFMSIAEDVTKKHGGSIDKIIGDTIMLVFRDNPKKESHGLRAAKASLELVEKAKASELPKLYTGIDSGRVISGRIGSYSGKLDFTVIGNPVNSASRFKKESKNGTTETGIIISGTTIELTKGKAKVKFLRRVSIKGKARKYNIYELIGVRD